MTILIDNYDSFSYNLYQLVGAINPEYIMPADKEMFLRLQERSGGLIKLVDIAPEEKGAMEFIEQCHDQVKISIAHTCSDYDTAREALEKGVGHMTHLYNAMPGINHREPGPIIAALEAGAEVELIADGIHIHPAMVRTTFRIFGADKVILISDSMEATGLLDGDYQLGGQGVTVKGRKAVLTKDPGVIAGSVTNLFDCMKNCELESYLRQGEIKASEKPPVPPQVLWVGDCTIATFGNFSTTWTSCAPNGQTQFPTSADVRMTPSKNSTASFHFLAGMI